MRLHAKLLGNNPFCIFPIWLVYCTFKRTERIKYTLWTALISKQFGKCRVVGTVLLSLGLMDAVCQRLHIPTTRTAETVSKCQKIPTEHGAEYVSPVQSYRMSIFSHPVQISQYGTILHLQWDSWQQITRIMVNCKKKTTRKTPKTNKQKRTEKDARVLTSVYFLSYHSLKLLPDSILKKPKYKYSSRHLLRTVSYPQLNFNALLHKHNIC